MQTSLLRVAALQLAVTLDRADNVRRAASLIDAAAAEGCKFVALPECFTGKYGVKHFANWAESVSAADTVTGGAAMMAEMARKHSITVTGGIVEEDNGKLYNSMPVFGPDGKLQSTYRKTHLSRVLGVTSESDVFTPGDEAVVAAAESFRVGMACCFDLRFPGFLAAYGPYSTADAASSDDDTSRCDVLCTPSAFLETTGVDHWDLLVRRAALDAQSYVVAPNVAFDASDAVPLHGRSVVCDPWGTILAQAGAAGDDMAIADVSRERLDEVRGKLPLAREGRRGFAPWSAEDA